MDKEIAKKEVENLVKEFLEYNKEDLNAKSENQIKSEFIDPLFEALGWNMRKDAEREERVLKGRADYILKIGNQNKLIAMTALPLKSVETDFALDSSGFGSYQYERWVRVRFQRMLGHEYSKRNYVKAHIAVGTTTQIITAIEVTTGTSSDTKQLPFLVGKTHENFEPKRWTADKAYSSRKNIQLIGSLEAIPFIAFKDNATGTTKGCPIWNAMFTYFQMYREQFDKFYHRRSLVESTFSSVKRKYGEFLRCKNFESQKNEVILKCLCHSIAILVEEIYQNNINVKFNSIKCL